MALTLAMMALVALSVCKPSISLSFLFTLAPNHTLFFFAYLFIYLFIFVLRSVAHIDRIVM